jgi:hypothetical protein
MFGSSPSRGRMLDQPDSAKLRLHLRLSAAKHFGKIDAP